MSKIIEERRVASVLPHQDQLNKLLGIIDSKYQLSDEDVINQIITLLYSGYETVSTTTMMVLKYLHDHPKALEELRVRLSLFNFTPPLLCDFLSIDYNS